MQDLLICPSFKVHLYLTDAWVLDHFVGAVICGEANSESETCTRAKFRIMVIVLDVILFLYLVLTHVEQVRQFVDGI